MTKSFLVFSALLSTLTASAAEISTQKVDAQDVDYGQMYVIQKRDTVEKPYSVNMGYSYGFSNPYFATHGLNLQGNYNVSDFVFVGLSPSFYAAADNDVPSNLIKELGAQGIDTKLFKPTLAAYAIVGVSPLTGMLNWFGTSSVNFDFSVGLGVGGIKYSNLDNMLLSVKLFAMPQVMLTKSLGVVAGVQTYFDRFTTKGNEWQNRVDVVGGISTRF